jgi:hypothetical protein
MREQEIQYLEEHIPALAQSAITQAYWQSGDLYPLVNIASLSE